MAILKDLIVLGNSRITSDLYAKTIYEDNVSLSSKYALVGHTHNYLPLGGGTLTGTLYTASSIYDTISGGHSGIGALHLNNSDITGVNAISTADLSDSWQESLAFKRSNGNWDTFRAADGTFYFGINNGTEYTAIHSGNYTSYTVKKDGTGATGSWGINVTGTSVAATRLLQSSSIDSLSSFTHSTDLIYIARGGSNTVTDKPSGVDAFGVLSFKTAEGWYGQLLMSSNTETGLYHRTNTTLSGGWKKILDSGNYTSYVNTTNFPGLNKTGTVTSVAVSNGGGLSISGSPITGSGTITISHSNSVTAQTTQALYPIKIDANGHISAYGSAVTSLPASDVYSWAKASTKPSYTLDEVSDGSSRKLANYLPLSGGTMTGAAPINFTANTVQMNFRPGHDSYNAKLEYMTNGNEALVFSAKASVTSFMFVNGLDLTNRSDYGAITSNPITMQLKSNKVSINRTIRGDSDSQTETLYVGGDTRVAGNNFYVGSASGSQCHQQYDTTNECLKFLFD